MTWHAVPVAVLAGVTGFAAIVFLGLYFALAKVAEEHVRREYLSFAVTCVCVVGYDIVSVGLYNSTSIEQGFFWQRGQLLTAAFIGIAYIIFAWDFLKRPIPYALRVANIIQAVLGLTVGFWESPYTLTLARPSIKHVKTLWNTVTYYETDPGIIAQALMGLFFVLYLANVRYIISYFRSRSKEKQRGKLGFLLAAVISYATATSDVLVSMGFYPFIYLLEYGIAALTISMAYVLLMRFGELHEAVDELNRSLTRTNADLVVALEQADESVRTKTEFLESISHELRTPLNAIINFPEGLLTEFVNASLVSCSACGAEFELEKGERLDEKATCQACGTVGLREQQRLLFTCDPAKTQSCLQAVANSGRHLLRLVDDIIDSSKLELGRTVLVRSSFSPLDLVSEVIDSTEKLASRKEVTVRLDEHIDGTQLGMLVADRAKIGQALRNLIDNAIKFSPQGSVVDVGVSAPTQGELEISVRDHGIGIANEHHAIIFDKFRQVDGGTTRAYGGPGLGLAISKGFIELHGGRISVESAKDRGASFFIRLPIVAPGTIDIAKGRRL